MTASLGSLREDEYSSLRSVVKDEMRGFLAPLGMTTKDCAVPVPVPRAGACGNETVAVVGCAGSREMGE